MPVENHVLDSCVYTFVFVAPSAHLLITNVLPLLELPPWLERKTCQAVNRLDVSLVHCVALKN